MQMPFIDKSGPISKDHTQLVLNRTWKPTLCVTGANGFPPIENAGNVLRAETALKLSVRYECSMSDLAIEDDFVAGCLLLQILKKLLKH